MEITNIAAAIEAQRAIHQYLDRTVVKAEEVGEHGIARSAYASLRSAEWMLTDLENLRESFA